MGDHTTFTGPHARGLALEHAYHWERVQPDAVWLVQPIGNGQVREYTWRQALDEARRMAAWLRSLGLPPNSNLALLAKNTAHWIICDFAIWMAGHTTVPIFPTLNAASVRQILEHSEAKLLFVGKLDAWESQRPGVDEALPLVRLPLSPETRGERWEDVVARQAPVEGSPTRRSEEIATIVYTSGSTGVPKGAMISFAAMIRAGICQQSAAARGGWNFGPDDRGLSYLPLAHCYERVLVEIGSLLMGSRIYFVERLDTFVEDLKRARPTLFQSVPRLWQQFFLGVSAKVPPEKLARSLKIPILGWVVKRKVLDGLGLRHCKVAVSGSAPIAPELLHWYRSLGLELLEGYGMTEDFACSHGSIGGKVRVGYVGPPLPGVEARLSEEGEVLVKSPGAMTGYFKQPELTAEAFTPDGFFRTGDRGEYDSEGRLRITGRVKELFKTSKGKYVAPVPIENLLMQHPRIEAACVSGAGHPQPHALVMLSPEGRLLASGDQRGELEGELSALLRKVNEELNGYEALAFIAVVKDSWTIENGFLTPTLKLKRARIDETYGGLSPAWYEQRRPVIWHA